MMPKLENLLLNFNKKGLMQQSEILEEIQ